MTFIVIEMSYGIMAFCVILAVNQWSAVVDNSTQTNTTAAVAGGVAAGWATKRLLERAAQSNLVESPEGYHYEKGSLLDKLHQTQAADNGIVNSKFNAAVVQAKQEAATAAADAKLMKKAKRSEAAGIALEEKNLTGASDKFIKLQETEAEVKKALLKNNPAYVQDAQKLNAATKKHSKYQAAKKEFDHAIAGHLEKNDPEIFKSALEPSRIEKMVAKLPKGGIAKAAVVAAVAVGAGEIAGKVFGHKTQVERLQAQAANQNLAAGVAA